MSSMSLDDWLRLLKEKDGSDLHLSSGSYPYMRIHGEMIKISDAVLMPSYLKNIFYSIINPSQRALFEETGDLDFGYEIPDVARFRCNYFKDRKGISAVFRLIPSEIRPIEELGLPDSLKDFCMINKGLVLVTGPTGSGKSTTLAAMIDYINRNRKLHVITIEDPIEFVHENKLCLINQREVVTHTKSFASALRGALREDPDVILVGEMRDLETIRLAVEAAATGHLVFSTLHTIGAAKTVDRIIEVFPAEEKNHIISLLADVIHAVISQTLVKRADKSGRIVLYEIMVANTAIRNLIRENKTYQIPMLMETSKKENMVLLDDLIIDYIKRGLVRIEDCKTLLSDKSKLSLLSDKSVAGPMAKTFSSKVGSKVKNNFSSIFKKKNE